MFSLLELFDTVFIYDFHHTLAELCLTVSGAVNKLFKNLSR